jgi:hypothetical protein
VSHLSCQAADAQAEASTRSATAERTFVFQRVFARAPDGSVQIVTLSPLLAADGAAVDADPCIGAPMSCEEARGIADGNIDPISRRAMVDLMPSTSDEPAKPAGATARRPSRPAQAGPPPAAQRGIAQFFAKTSASQRPAQASSGPSGFVASSASPLKPRSLNAPDDPVASRAQPALRRSAAQCLALYADGSDSEPLATGTRSKFFKLKSSPTRASPESRSPEPQDIASSSPGPTGEDDAEVEALYASGFSQLQNVSSSAPSADAGTMGGMLSRIDAGDRARLVSEGGGHDGAISSPESVSARSDDGTRPWARGSPPTPDPLDASPTRAAAHRRTSKSKASTASVLGESRMANASVLPLHLSFAAIPDEADEAPLAQAGDSLRSRFTFAAADEGGDATLLGVATAGSKRKLELCSPGAAVQSPALLPEQQSKRTKNGMQLKRTASLGFGTSPSPGAAGASAPLLRRHVSATTPSRPPLVGASSRTAVPRPAEASSSRKKKQSVLPMTTTSPGCTTSNSLWAQFARR